MTREEAKEHGKILLIGDSDGYVVKANIFIDDIYICDTMGFK